MSDAAGRAGPPPPPPVVGGGGGHGRNAHVAETLTYYAFPDCHWIKIRTNNPLERIMREIRRRTRVVGAFPDGQSCLNLAAARLRHIAGTQWSTRKYMNMAPLRAAKNEAYGAAIA
jgi:putative transposase